jgi:hypothetical protein
VSRATRRATRGCEETKDRTTAFRLAAKADYWQLLLELRTHKRAGRWPQDAPQVDLERTPITARPLRRPATPIASPPGPRPTHSSARMALLRAHAMGTVGAHDGPLEASLLLAEAVVAHGFRHWQAARHKHKHTGTHLAIGGLAGADTYADSGPPWPAGLECGTHARFAALASLPPLTPTTFAHPDRPPRHLGRPSMATCSPRPTWHSTRSRLALTRTRARHSKSLASSSSSGISSTSR